jgi:hypothetical protein
MYLYQEKEEKAKEYLRIRANARCVLEVQGAIHSAILKFQIELGWTSQFTMSTQLIAPGAITRSVDFK